MTGPGSVSRRSRHSSPPASNRPRAYYARELLARLRQYGRARVRGDHYRRRDRDSLEDAAAEIVEKRAASGFRPGAHFTGIWPRDLCFSAPGIVARGFESELRAVGEWLVRRFDDVFFTEVRREYGAAVPTEGVDTFPALVMVLATCDRLASHAEALAGLAALHRRTFFDEETMLVTGEGCGWWDSAAAPREAYNTAMLLAALERLECAGVETTYSGALESVRTAWRDRLWTGEYVAERRDSSVLACDANVVPLYFGLVSDARAQSIVDALETLETERGCLMRARPFTVTEVHPFFLLHRDYHYHIWPWNSLLYAIGARKYGFDARARREVARLERTLRPYGTFLEVYTLEGKPYVKRGYAAADEFTVAAALWSEYTDGQNSTNFARQC